MPGATILSAMNSSALRRVYGCDTESRRNSAHSGSLAYPKNVVYVSRYERPQDEPGGRQLGEVAPFRRIPLLRWDGYGRQRPAGPVPFGPQHGVAGFINPLSPFDFITSICPVARHTQLFHHAQGAPVPCVRVRVNRRESVLAEPPVTDSRRSFRGHSLPPHVPGDVVAELSLPVLVLGIDGQADQPYHASVVLDREYGPLVPGGQYRLCDYVFGASPVVGPRVIRRPLRVAGVLEHVVDIRQPEGPEQKPLRPQLGGLGHNGASWRPVPVPLAPDWRRLERSAPQGIMVVTSWP